MIQNKKSEFRRRVSNSVSVHRVILEGEALDVVYDNKRKLVKTVLYPFQQQEQT